MIPLAMTLRVQTDRGHRVRLWLPLFLLWLLILPLLILLLPFYLVFCVLAGVNPLRWVVAFWGLLSAVGGTHIEVDTPHSCVFMRIN